MAKINVTGMSIKDILNMPIQQINSMNRADLSAVASRLVSASNKRIRRLEASPNGKMSPSYLSYKKRGKPFSVKGKDVNQLRNEMKQMKKFLSQKTSSVSGWKKFKKQFEKRVGGSMTPEQTDKFWKVYRRLEEEEGGVIQIIQDSDRIQKLLHQEIAQNGSVDEIFQNMMDNLDKMYDELMSETMDDWDTSDVFTFGSDF